MESEMMYPVVVGMIGFFCFGYGAVLMFDADLIKRLPLIIIGIFLFVTGNAALCPRCKLNIARKATIWRHSGKPIPRYCFRCGRNRKGVWPYQFLFKAEAWDGKYHDEGGGEQQQGAYPSFYGDKE